MKAIIADRDRLQISLISSRRPAHGPHFPDPLNADEHPDALVITTKRAIDRVALVATEAANRFYQGSLPHDPMAWMFATRRVFGGGAAIDACLGRDDCMRGIPVHVLGLGLDVSRTAVDALLAYEDDDSTGDEDRYIPPWFIRPDEVSKEKRQGPGNSHRRLKI